MITLLLAAQLYLYSDKPITVDASPLCQNRDNALSWTPPPNTMCIIKGKVITRQLIFKNDFEVKE